MSSSEDSDYNEEEEERSAKGDDDGMEDFDEDYDSDDSDIGPKKKKRRKGSKRKVNDFILDEAEVDDDVDEDEGEWEEGAEEIIDTKGGDQSRARELDSHRRLTRMFNEQKEDEIEEYYRKKYAEQQRLGYEGGEGDLPDDIAQQALQPGVKDPNLWMVKCRMGEEKATVLALMRKFIAFQNSDKEIPLQFKSVIAPEGIKGYIYIEAYKQAHVKEAIEGVRALTMGLYKQQMIPIKEMTDVLRVTKDRALVRPKQWVRLRRGIYKDDLAQVDYVDTAQGQVHLKLIPRIDYKRKRGALREQSDPENNNLKRKLGKRPVAKLFDPEAIRSIGGDISTDGDFQIFEGNKYRRGFLYKLFPQNALIIDGVKPSLSELDKFEETAEGGDVDDTHVAEGKEHNLASGDFIEVVEGELINLTGKILSIDGPKILMMPKHEDLRDPIEFQVHEVRKFFKVGDHIKIIGGQFEGDTGLVVRVEEKQIVMFSDLTQHEIKVLPKDCQVCPDMATGVDSTGHFQLGDMVQIDATTVGVIVRLEKEFFQVLDIHGKIKHLRHQMVTKRRDAKRAVALDSEQNQIAVKDHVRVIDGNHIGRQGEIRHLYRGFAFIHCRLLMENGGLFVCKTRHLTLAGSTRSMSTDPSLMAGYMSPQVSMTSPMHPSSGGSGGGMPRMNVNNRGGRDKSDLELIGKTIKVTKGHFKGHIGIVKDAIGEFVRVELHASCQTINVAKANIVEVSGQSGRVTGSMTTYGRTPMYGSQTPMVSGARTPMYDFGSRTPMYDGSRTPGRDGSRTPMYDPSRTPVHTSSAWDPSAATPKPDFDDYGAEPSPSPAYNNPPTPGYLNPDTPSAGPYTPQTPGMYSSYNQPSPAAPSPAGSYSYGQGLTPSPTGYNFSPATPGAGPSTPLGFNPHTPGAGMEHILERKDEWQTTDIYVRIRSGDDPDLIGQTGIIRGITGNMCSLFLVTEDRVVNILSDHLEPSRPVRGDFVKVIYGDLREASGKLIDIDGTDGIVNLEQGSRMIPMTYLCKAKQS